MGHWNKVLLDLHVLTRHYKNGFKLKLVILNTHLCHTRAHLPHTLTHLSSDAPYDLPEYLVTLFLGLSMPSWTSPSPFHSFHHSLSSHSCISFGSLLSSFTLPWAFTLTIASLLPLLH